MPELPEVELLRKYIDDVALNKKVANVIIRDARMVEGFQRDHSNNVSAVGTSPVPHEGENTFLQTWAGKPLCFISE